MATGSKCNVMAMDSSSAPTAATASTHPTGLAPAHHHQQQQHSFSSNHNFLHYCSNSNYNYSHGHHNAFPGLAAYQVMKSDDEGMDNSDMMIMERKRGLDRVQIDWLERSFQEDGRKLDAERKMKLSQELGLKPRQVAIWFQNRLARWKNKQLQQHYDSLKQENQNLRYQLMKLKAKLEELQELKTITEKRMSTSTDWYTEEALSAAAEGTGESTPVGANEISNRIIHEDHHDGQRDPWLHL